MSEVIAMTDPVIRALLVEKANLLQAGVRMPAESEERFLNDAAIALLDLQISKCRERLDVKRRAVKVAPILRVA
jgi:hypothetical protein